MLTSKDPRTVRVHKAICVSRHALSQPRIQPSRRRGICIRPRGS